jgi:hypothetical protein
VPTFERRPRFDREFRRLPQELQRAFLGMLPLFIAALRKKPPAFPRSLRVKGVQGHPGVYELSFGAGGRATFAYGDEVVPGEPHVIWRRIGDRGGAEHPGEPIHRNKEGTWAAPAGLGSAQLASISVCRAAASRRIGPTTSGSISSGSRKGMARV